MSNSLKILLQVAIFVFALISIGCSIGQPKPSPHPHYPSLRVDTVQLKIETSLDESSGLTIIHDKLWTHNDSGGEPELYEFEQTSGKINQSVRILDQKNKDWEEMTKDSQYVYIGNFGNNVGSRKDLEIYKVHIDSILTKDEVVADVIEFHYPEQEDFPGNYNHNFDCEAFLTFGDSLYLFTKNWENKKCDIYSVPKASGKYAATWISQFNTEGVITGATFNPEDNQIVLLGYNLEVNKFYPFIWKLENFTDTDFFGRDKTRYNLKIRRQTEAIVWSRDNEYLLSAEGAFNGHASLYRLTVSH